ncbi:MAG TPA: tetratricopeptide repeat protein [Phycisphaerae bacterium]|nr:tetratricopeptide repeat protein [Phycisphaerae bacterium]HRW56126.1 tetratricopeptide repeat protein [Phycisphaerae bacterium]
MTSLITVICAMVLQAPATGPQAKPEESKKSDGVKNFAVPGRDYGLAIDLKGFTIEEDKLYDDGRGRYVRASRRRNNVNVSFWLLPAEEKGDSKHCRETWWKKEKNNPFKPEDVRMREKDDLAIVDYMVRQPVEQSNVRAYLADKKTWIDVHISKVNASEKDLARIDKLLDSVKIVAPCPTDVKMDLVLGSRFYLKRNYVKASWHYQRVLDAEKEKRTLDTKSWRVVVDNLGMAYGIRERLERARETFEYGIAEDPDYPMFYYNLACTYGEMNDLKNAIKYLKAAFERRAHLNPGERMPDPRADSSFKRFLKKSEFRETLKEIGY